MDFLKILKNKIVAYLKPSGLVEPPLTNYEKKTLANLSLSLGAYDQDEEEYAAHYQSLVAGHKETDSERGISTEAYKVLLTASFGKEDVVLSRLINNGEYQLAEKIKNKVQLTLEENLIVIKYHDDIEKENERNRE